MRPLLPYLIFALFVAWSFTAHAQVQERKLMDRILKPNESLTFDLKNATFNGGKSFSTGAANVKEFYIPQRFNSKEFRTESYAGTKGFWMGDFKYTSKAFDTKQSARLASVIKPFGTKEVPVVSASESSKAFGVKKFATKATSFSGRSQHKIDEEGPGAQSSIGLGGNSSSSQGSVAMGDDGKYHVEPVDTYQILKELKTIDDVRELLNKSK